LLDHSGSIPEARGSMFDGRRRESGS
jgi:hypothetical protein